MKVMTGSTSCHFSWQPMELYLRSVMIADAKNEHFHKRLVGLGERQWPAHIFKIGDVLIGV